MFLVEFIQIRPNLETKWFPRNRELSEAIELEKFEGRLLLEKFNLSRDGLTGRYTAVWEDREKYLNFFENEHMKNYIVQRREYFETHNIAMKRITAYIY